MVQRALKESFPQLLTVAQSLASATPEEAREAGSIAFITLFAAFHDAFDRQVPCHTPLELVASYS